MPQRRKGRKAQGLIWPEASKPQAPWAENTMSRVARCQATNSGPQAVSEVHCTATDTRPMEERTRPGVLPLEGVLEAIST